MASIFNQSPSARIKSMVLRSPAGPLVRRTRLLLWACEDYVLDRIAGSCPQLKRRLLIASMPKAGLHLLEQALRCLPELARRPMPLPNSEPVARHRRSLGRLALNRYAHWHYAARQETFEAASANGLAVVVIQRDPRDVLVSFVDHVVNSPEHPFHSLYMKLPTTKDRLFKTIRGLSREEIRSDAKLSMLAQNNPVYPGIVDIGVLCRGYLGWRDYRPVHWVRFEDLIGERGGGSIQAQLGAVRGLLDFLEIEHRDALVAEVAGRIYNPDSTTFNVGVSGRWKSSFDSELEELFSEVAQGQLEAMGYASEAAS